MRTDKIILHPILFAVFPSLSYLGQIVFVMGGMSRFLLLFGTLLTGILFALAFWFAVNYFVKDIQKSAILTSVFLFFLLSYWHFLRFIFKALGLDQHRILFCILCVLYAIFTVLILRSGEYLKKLTHIFNVTGTVLVIIGFVRLFYTTGIDLWLYQSSVKKYEDGRAADLRPQPDIYYFILDTYGGTETLSNNKAFVDYLTKKGFYIARHSSANYCYTDTSLVSSLNFCYLKDLKQRVRKEDEITGLSGNWINGNRTFQFFRERGYKIAVYLCLYPIMDFTNIETNISKPNSLFDSINLLFLASTPAPIVFPLEWVGFLSRLFIDRDFYAMDYLIKRSETQTPTFVFAHFWALHPPYVFKDKDKKPKYRIDSNPLYVIFQETDNTRKGNKERLDFYNAKLEKLLDSLLSKKGPAPIIVLQGDHSLENGENGQNLILNAYYLPDFDYRDLYNTISPVNTFRIILNHYFGMHLRLLEDKTYYGQRVTDMLNRKSNIKRQEE